jgi:hypothetical protein
MEIRVASLLSSFGTTGAGSTGHPAVSLFQVASPNVAAGTPHTTSSGSAGVRTPDCPESRIHSALPAVFKFRVPPQLYFARRASRCIAGFPVFASSGPAGDRSSSCPDFRILQRLCCASLRFPRCLALPVAPADTGSRLPRFLHLPALPATDLRVTPNLSFFGASGA